MIHSADSFKILNHSGIKRHCVLPVFCIESKMQVLSNITQCLLPFARYEGNQKFYEGLSQTLFTVCPFAECCLEEQSVVVAKF